MIDATTGPARHLIIPHANDNQTNSKRPLHIRVTRMDSRDSPEVLTHQRMKKETQSITRQDYV